MSSKKFEGTWSVLINCGIMGDLNKKWVENVLESGDLCDDNAINSGNCNSFICSLLILLVIETDPHITVHMGLDNNIELVRSICKRTKPFYLSIKNMGKFSNVMNVEEKERKWDVLWREIPDEKGELNDLHQQFVNAFNKTWHHPKYNAHLTVAYLKHGAADKYIDTDREVSATIHVKELIYKKFKSPKEDIFIIPLEG